MEITSIKKDDILNVKFPEEDVLKTDAKKSHRWLQLKIAAQGWNEPKSIKEIVFKSEKRGLLSVKSVVNKTKPKCVILNGGYVIPIRSIYEIH